MLILTSVQGVKGKNKNSYKLLYCISVHFWTFTDLRYCQPNSWKKLITKFVNSESLELLAKVRNLPFDRLRVNGLMLKLFSFSVRGELVEPQKNTFARGSLYIRKLFFV